MEEKMRDELKGKFGRGVFPFPYVSSGSIFSGFITIVLIVPLLFFNLSMLMY